MDSPIHSMRIPLTQNNQNHSLHLSYDPLRVYPPNAYSAVLMTRNLNVLPGDVALELGTGTGAFSIAIALMGGQKVVAVDILDDALNTAKGNAEKNGVADRIEFRKGSMFDPVNEGEKFSLIVCSPPCLPDPGPIDLIIPGQIMLSGSDGSQHGTLLIQEAPKYLAPGGRLVFVYPSTSNPRKIFGMLDQNYNYKILVEIEIPFYLHFLELWDYLASLKEQGLCDYTEQNGVPYRTYWLIEAYPK